MIDLGRGGEGGMMVRTYAMSKNADKQAAIDG
jgi:hypothetical protein